ncbi:MAG: hypothetical protein AAF662_03550 [Pseudomonadota bacterium]
MSSHWLDTASPLRVPAIAVMAGLVFGVLSGLFQGGGAAIGYVDDWSAFPDTGRGDTSEALATLAVSTLWRSEAAEAAAPKGEDTAPGKSGLLAYFSLVAVINDPEPAALIKIAARVPEDLGSQLLLAADSDGLVTVGLGDEVTSGWRVSAIADTSMTLAADPGQEKADEEPLVYDLFE